MTYRERCEGNSVNPEAIRKWMMLNYQVFNLREIESLCGIPTTAILKDLANEERMPNEHWYQVYILLYDILSEMPNLVLSVPDCNAPMKAIKALP